MSEAEIEVAVPLLIGSPQKLTPAELAFLAEHIAQSITIEVEEIPAKIITDNGWTVDNASPDDTTMIGVRIGWVCCMSPVCDKTPGVALLYGAGGPAGGDVADRFTKLVEGAGVMNERAKQTRRQIKEVIEEGWE